MPVEKVSITIAPDVIAQVNQRVEPDVRGKRSMVISRDLERYYTLLDAGRAQLNDLFTDGELSLLLNANTNPAYVKPSHIRLLAYSAEDTLSRDQAKQLFGVDRDALTEKLRSLDPLSLFALADAIERFCLLPDDAAGVAEFRTLLR